MTLTFNGEIFCVGERIDTTLDYNVYDLMYQYDVLNLENMMAVFSLGLIAKVKLVDGSVVIDSPCLSADKDFIAPIPMLGLNLHIGILSDLLEARMLATGIGYGEDALFEGQADLSFTPLPFIDIHGGYRALYFDADTEDVELNYDTYGPYVCVTISF